MRFLRKKPADIAEVVELDGKLETLQKEVGGYIQMFPLLDSIALICNKDGKFTGLPYNFPLGAFDNVVGTALFVREDKENFCSLSDADIKKVCAYFGFEVSEFETMDLPL